MACLFRRCAEKCAVFFSGPNLVSVVIVRHTERQKAATTCLSVLILLDIYADMRQLKRLRVHSFKASALEERLYTLEDVF